MELLVTILSVYLALSIALACAFGIFLANRKELRRMARELEAIRRESETVTPPPGGPVNLNRRSQILRLSRMGEPPETIAAMVGAPPAEVNLALKVAKLPLELFETRA
jgi:predicted outer membrane lipoprotein